MRLVIGSRGSKLALWQAEWVRARLVERGASAEIQVITTTGDKMALASPTAPTSKGIFIKEIEGALLAGAIDVAVHSMKDLPADLTPELSIAAVPEREDARDALATRDGAGLAGLAQAARVGTGSPRRASQLRSLRRDLIVEPIRGNVDTRLRKLQRGDFDALIMAAAGLRRLGLAHHIAQYFDPAEICPAPGQGALAVQIRRNDDRAAEAVGPLDHPPTRRAVTAERATLRRLGGGCQTPLAAFAVPDGNSLTLSGAVASTDGQRVIRAAMTFPGDPEAAGVRLAEALLAQGAAALLGI